MPMVVVGITGCIAAYKACEVVRELQKRDVDVWAVMTQNAARFVTPLTLETLTHHPVFIDQFVLGEGSDIRHISLADSADLILVAPATANTIGKFARGIADDALSTLYTATTAPVLVAPAMNVNMLRHPAVLENLAVLRSRGVGIIEPGSGYLACGWLGDGRLAETADIVEAAMAALSRRRDMEGEVVLVTAGPTVEDIDPVRFVSNRSTGRMGYRLAEAARDRGAKVVLVSGPTSLPVPARVDHVGVRSAEEMQAAVARRVGEATIVAMAAAVSDYRPATVAPAKMKKTEGPARLELVRTPDILRSLGASKGERFVVGFAAETEALLENARRKRTEKHMDLIVANDVSADGSGFASDYNAATLIDELGEVEVPLASKRELADKIWDRVAEVRRSRTAAASTKARGRGGKPA
jgi:phosphopantothenoylcysteine decarboxylase / phosphopantothenate---cysteine ligase